MTADQILPPLVNREAIDETDFQVGENVFAWIRRQDQLPAAYFATRSVLRSLPHPWTIAQSTTDNEEFETVFYNSLPAIIAAYLQSIGKAKSAKDILNRLERVFEHEDINKQAVRFGEQIESLMHLCSATTEANIGIAGTACIQGATLIIREAYNQFPNTYLQGMASSAVDADVSHYSTCANPNMLFAKPLWHDMEPLPGIGDDWIGLQEHAKIDDAWSFWRDWYQGFLDGKPLDWELQKEIALIPDTEWEKGPEWIAGLIDEIRKKYDRKPLDQEQVTEQARRLIAQPETAAIVTSAVADQIDEAIEQYFFETEVNQLPEALEPLHLLPPLLRRVAESSQSEDRITELEAQIKELVATVNALNDALEKAKGQSRRDMAIDTAITTTVKIATAAFWGTVAAGVSHVTGIIDVGNLLERLSSAVPELPHVLEVPAPRPPPAIDG